jgi:hypothetical protein
MPYTATDLEAAVWRDDVDAVKMSIEVAGADSASGLE